MSVKIFYDLETTGVEVKKHSIHQIAGIVEVDGEVAETFDIRTRPHPKAEITEKAMIVGGVTEEQVLAYKPMREAYFELRDIVLRYIDSYSTTDRATLIGFNNRFFDDQFLRAWFKQNESAMFDNWFWSDTRDVMVLASEYLDDRRSSMPSFKLKRVALTLGINVDESRLHDGGYDVELTRKIYRTVTFLEIEL